MTRLRGMGGWFVAIGIGAGGHGGWAAATSDEAVAVMTQAAELVVKGTLVDPREERKGDWGVKVKQMVAVGEVYKGVPRQRPLPLWFPWYPDRDKSTMQMGARDRYKKGLSKTWFLNWNGTEGAYEEVEGAVLWGVFDDAPTPAQLRRAVNCEIPLPGADHPPVDFGFRFAAGRPPLTIQRIVPKSPAEVGRFHAGDVLLSVERQPVIEIWQFHQIAQAYARGTKLKVRTKRSGVERDVWLQMPGEASGSGDAFITGVIQRRPALWHPGGAITVTVTVTTQEARHVKGNPFEKWVTLKNAEGRSVWQYPTTFNKPGAEGEIPAGKQDTFVLTSNLPSDLAPGIYTLEAFHWWNGDKPVAAQSVEVGAP